MARQKVADLTRRTLCEFAAGRVLAPRLEVADAGWKRAVGLLGRKCLDADSGLWLTPCNGVHTLLMRFPIDVLYLDKHGVVLRVVPNLRPFRVALPLRGTRTMLELPANSCAALEIVPGTRLMLTEITAE